MAWRFARLYESHTEEIFMHAQYMHFTDAQLQDALIVSIINHGLGVIDSLVAIISSFTG